MLKFNPGTGFPIGFVSGIFFVKLKMLYRNKKMFVDLEPDCVSNWFITDDKCLRKKSIYE